MLRRGKEKGKRGIVKAVFPKDGNGDRRGPQRRQAPHQAQVRHGSRSGGIFEKEAPIPLCVAASDDPEDERADARAPHPAERTAPRVRVAKSGEQLLVPAKAGK